MATGNIMSKQFHFRGRMEELTANNIMFFMKKAGAAFKEREDTMKLGEELHGEDESK